MSSSKTFVDDSCEECSQRSDTQEFGGFSRATTPSKIASIISSHAEALNDENTNDEECLRDFHHACSNAPHHYNTQTRMRKKRRKISAKASQAMHFPSSLDSEIDFEYDISPYRFSRGDAVEAKFVDNKWYPAVVVWVHKNGTEYTVDWDDGDPTHRRKSMMDVRPLELKRPSATSTASLALSGSQSNVITSTCSLDENRRIDVCFNSDSNDDHNWVDSFTPIQRKIKRRMTLKVQSSPSESDSQSDSQSENSMLDKSLSFPGRSRGNSTASANRSTNNESSPIQRRIPTSKHDKTRSVLSANARNSLGTGGISIQDAFAIYVQYIASGCIDKDCFEAFKSDRYFAVPIQKIDEAIVHRRDFGVLSPLWPHDVKQQLGRHPLLSFTSSTEGGRCDACMKSNHAVCELVYLRGNPYDSTTFEELSVSPRKKHKVGPAFRLGKTCGARVRSYHRLLHYPNELYNTCQRKLRVLNEMEHTPLGPSTIESLMDDLSWIRRLEEEFNLMLAEADRFRK